MTLSEYIQQRRPLLEKFILDFLKTKKQRKESELIFISNILNKLDLFVVNGKLLRGLQVVLAYEMYHGKHLDEVLKLGAALELMHSFILIHDDIMDNDLTRRGMKTVFAEYIEQGNSANVFSPKFYAQSQGMIAGDITGFLGFELISSLLCKDTTSQEILKILCQELQILGGAQMQEFYFGQSNYEPNLEEIFQVYRYKTARYTFSLPLMIGAMLAEASEEQVKLLEEFGESLGIIFQIKDDELGLFGTEEQIGKPVGTDIKENKKTIFRHYLFEALTHNERIYIESCFGNADFDAQKEMPRIRELFEKYKIVAKINEKAETLLQETLKTLDEVNVEKEYKDVLRELVYYNLDRKK